MRKILKIVLLTLQSVLIFAVIGATSYAITKNIQKIVLVEVFKSKGVFHEEISTEDLKFYRIESDEEKEAFRKYNNTIYPGVHGDILVSTEATLINPLVSNFISFFAGGHAAVCIDYSDKVTVENNMTIEASGVNGDDDAQLFKKNYWVTPNVFNEVIGLRMDMTKKQRDSFVDNAAQFLGYPYNYSFIFNTKNSIYCSDLVSRSAKPVGFNLNKDNGTTTIYDLIVSSDTYIFYYHYTDKEGIKHIYYLD
jgi:uncharacterized protein YycO